MKSLVFLADTKIIMQQTWPFLMITTLSLGSFNPGVANKKS